MATYLVPYTGQTYRGATVTGRAILFAYPEELGRSDIFRMEAEIIEQAAEEHASMRVASVLGFYRLADPTTTKEPA